MRNIVPFQYAEVTVRTITDESGRTWFAAKDVCEVLGLGNVSMALAKIPEDHKGINRIDTLGGAQNLNMVDEPGLYRLVLRSDKPQAEPFMEWVTSDVLPTIRQTGSYSPVPQLPDFTDPAAAARAWAEQFDAKQKALAEGEAARRQIEHDRPKVALANAISECEKAIRFEQFAKVVFEKFGLGRNRLYKILREVKVLRFNNEPYQEYMERGWFKQVEKTYINSKTEQTVPYFMTLITGKGQLGIFKMLEKHSAIQKAVANA